MGRDAEEKNVPGRWHFAEDAKDKQCLLIGEGLNSGLLLFTSPNKFMISVMLRSGRRPADRDDGPGTITVASTSNLRGLLNRFEQVTIPFVREPSTQTTDSR